MKNIINKFNKLNTFSIVVAVLLGIIVSIGVFVMFNFMIYNQSEEQCLERFTDENSMTAARLDNLLESDIKKLDIVSSLLLEFDSLRAKATADFLESISKTSGFEKVFLMFSNGDIVGSDSDTSRYKQIMHKVFDSKSGITFVTDDENEKCDIIAYVPVFEGRSVLAGVVDRDYYATGFNMSNSSMGDRIIVADEIDGTVIMSFDSYGRLNEYYYGSLFDQSIGWGLCDDTTIEQLSRDMKADVAGYYKYSSEEKKEYISYYPMSSNEWSVLMTMPYDRITEEAGSSRRDLSIIVLILLGLYMFILFLTVLFQRQRNKETETIKMQYKVSELANEAKTRFMSNMSHDIRTPLNAIVGLADICEMNADNPDRVRDCIAKQKAASEHLMTLINDVLDMSRIESGKVVFGNSEFDIGEQIHELVVMLRKTIREKKLSFHLAVGDIEHEKVMGDVQRINRVLINILSNAIKYTNSGGRISIFADEQKADKHGYSNYVYRITDTGIGMTEEFVKKIFIPFERMEDSTVSKIEGAGLGMTIAHELVLQMGGKIDVESVLGQGTTITVSIPLEYVEDNSGQDILDKHAGQYIIVVDDDPKLVAWVERLTERIGMKCVAKTSGFEALNSIKEIYDDGGEIALIILAWLMPRIDGVDLATEIRRLIGKDVIIALQTSKDVDVPDKKIRAAGINNVLVEPVFKSDIINILNEAGNKESDGTPRIPDFTGKRVLLVEDHLINAEIVAEYLNYTGITVELVNDGTEAVDKMYSAEDGYYDIILMDIRMPKMNGYEATKIIRGMDREYAKNVPIIALSANAFAEDIKKSREVGMNGHLAKPIKYDEIYAELNKWF